MPSPKSRNLACFAIAIVVALALLGSGCQLPFFGQKAAGGTGALTIHTGLVTGRSFTIFPEAPLVGSYKAVLSRQGYSDIAVVSGGSTLTTSGLVVGTWSLRVTAWSEADAEGSLLGDSGPVSVEIQTAATTNVTVSVLPHGIGSGRLEVTYEWSTELADTAEIRLSRLSNPTTLIIPEADLLMDVAAGTASISTALPSAASDPYVLVLQLGKDGTAHPPVVRLVHVYANLTSKASIAVTPDMLTGGALTVNINLEAPENPSYTWSGLESTLNKATAQAMTVSVTTTGITSYRWYLDNGDTPLAEGAAVSSVTVNSAELVIGAHTLRLEVVKGGHTYTATVDFSVKNEVGYNLALNITYGNAAEPAYNIQQDRVVLDQAVAQTMTVSAAENLGTYAWFVDNVLVSGHTERTITLSGADYALGMHSLMLRVLKDGVYDTVTVPFEVVRLTAYSGGRGTIAGQVKEVESGNALAGVQIRAVSGGVNFVTTTDADGNYSLGGVRAGTDISVGFSKATYQSVSYVDIVVEADQTTTVETVLSIPGSYTGNGTVSGIIRDAFTGAALSGVSVTLRPGMGKRTGDAAADPDTTDGSGAFSFTDLPTGHYTAEASMDGYITGYFTVISLGGQTRSGQNASISPVLADGEIRAVLSWGATPADLDIMLDVPKSGHAERLDYNFREVKIGGTVVATLDNDVLDGHGPETMTIKPPQASGTFTLHVLNWTDYEIHKSNAVVRVYKGEEGSSALWKEFYVPNIEGDYWTVFTLNGSSITPVNTVTNAEYENAVATVTYQNGSGGASVQDSFYKGQPYLLRDYASFHAVAQRQDPPASFEPPEGENFVGWATSHEGEVVYTDSQKIDLMGSAAIDLWAVFE
jgi:hypothetical protein